MEFDLIGFSRLEKKLDLSGGRREGGIVSALTAPHAGGVDQARVPGGGQGLNCNPEGKTFINKRQLHTH